MNRPGEQRSQALQDAQSAAGGGTVGGSAQKHPWRQQVCGEVLPVFFQGLLCSLPLSLPHGKHDKAPSFSLPIGGTGCSPPPPPLQLRRE